MYTVILFLGELAVALLVGHGKEYGWEDPFIAWMPHIFPFYMFTIGYDLCNWRVVKCGRCRLDSALHIPSINLPQRKSKPRTMREYSYEKTSWREESEPVEQESSLPREEKRTHLGATRRVLPSYDQTMLGD